MVNMGSFDVEGRKKVTTVVDAVSHGSRNGKSYEKLSEERTLGHSKIKMSERSAKLRGNTLPELAAPRHKCGSNLNERRQK